MPIDPARLARIRARILAAATLAVPACGGVPPHVNDRSPEPPTVNNPPTDEKPHDGPINEREADPPPASPVPKHINTPEPQPDVNRPKPQ